MNKEQTERYICSVLTQHLFEVTDPLIQVALINTMSVVHQHYPTISNIHTNELLDFGKQTSERLILRWVFRMFLRFIS